MKKLLTFLFFLIIISRCIGQNVLKNDKAFFIDSIVTIALNDQINPLLKLRTDTNYYEKGKYSIGDGLYFRQLNSKGENNFDKSYSQKCDSIISKIEKTVADSIIIKLGYTKAILIDKKNNFIIFSSEKIEKDGKILFSNVPEKITWVIDEYSYGSEINDLFQSYKRNSENTNLSLFENVFLKTFYDIDRKIELIFILIK